MKKVELLAPAGDYKAFQGAIHAGADAVYLGGPRFGARAYAPNFTEEEVCKAVRYAHLFGRKVYLTLNTLMKESEMEQLYDYLLPYYCAGLDGVIVQDMGVVRFVRRQFPEMELHISTQAAITGRFGAKLMKEAGAVRVVPARELSLQEIRHIKEETGLEIETFIHGSVCYCYSGLCLFSSTLGGRSGNRGRCAQPCRLPYSSQGSRTSELYPLSLKDMCTIEHIPELIGAGIDSFKIEGRMKKAEYAAGVTAIYRKYIDKYYEDPDAPFQVEAKDMEKLRSLYIRSELQDGYYFRHNGKEMVTLQQPGYAGNDEALLQRIREKYLEKAPKLPAQLKVSLMPGKEALLTASCNGAQIRVSGMEVQAAQKRPLTKEDVKKQLTKTGDTAFWCEEIEIEIKGDIFLPVSALNELRRSAFEVLAQTLLMRSEREKPCKVAEEEEETAYAAIGCVTTKERDTETEAGQKAVHETSASGLRVEVFSITQALEALHQPGIGRLYLPAESFVCMPEGEAGIGSVFAQIEIYRQENPGFTFYMALPHIFRKRSEKFMEAAYRNLNIPQVDGVLVRNLEEVGWLMSKGYQGKVQTDAALYIWNKEAERFWGGLRCWNDRCQFGELETTLPLELSRNELRELSREGRELIVYGRAPLMITANCVKKTMAKCLAGEKVSDKKTDFFYLTDRYRKNFPVWTNCEQCYNVIYNSVPTSLHVFLKRRREWEKTALRIVFTTEGKEETAEIVRFFNRYLEGAEENGAAPFEEYTSSYFKRGVE